MINSEFYNITQGCITAGIAPQFDGCIDVVVVNGGNIHSENVSIPSFVDTCPVKSDTKVTVGLVCGVDIGMNVLYASDDALITIDGKYLIVQKQN